MTERDNDPAGVNLDAFFAERPELRPPEEMVRKAMREMGVGAESGQTDLFEALQTVERAA